MKYSALTLNLVQQVAAQDSDANLQPTFGTLTGIDLPGTTASLLLTASSTNVQVGSNVAVDVEVRTGSFTISEYRIVVDFDPTKLAVVDADPNTPGTQVELLDQVFQVTAGDNSTSAAGRITLIAKTSAGNALQVNRKVVRINFQAQSLGATNVKVVTGSTGSQLINQNGVAIASSVNSVTLNVGNEAQPSSTSSSTTSTTTTNTTSPTTTVTTTTPTDGTPTIPDTALPEDIVAIITVVTGLSLLGLGAVLRRHRKPYGEE